MPLKTQRSSITNEEAETVSILKLNGAASSFGELLCYIEKTEIASYQMANEAYSNLIIEYQKNKTQEIELYFIHTEKDLRNLTGWVVSYKFEKY